MKKILSIFCLITLCSYALADEFGPHKSYYYWEGNITEFTLEFDGTRNTDYEDLFEDVVDNRLNPNLDIQVDVRWFAPFGELIMIVDDYGTSESAAWTEYEDLWFGNTEAFMYFNTSILDNHSDAKIQGLMVHEFGHTMGLNHHSSNQEIMYWSTTCSNTCDPTTDYIHTIDYLISGIH